MEIVNNTQKKYMNKILITGGSGFIGTNAVEYFTSKGNLVRNIDIKKPINEYHEKFWEKCDIRNLKEYTKQVLDFNPDYYIHLAARTDLNENKNITGYNSNILGVANTVNVINKCKNLKRVIFASSRMVCKIDYIPKNSNDYCPPNLYGESKVKGEILIKTSNINSEWIIVRPTSIWGPWFDLPYKTFFTLIKKKKYFHPGKHNPKKSFGFVGNSVYQLNKLLLCSSELINKKILYLCDYPPLVLQEWAKIIQNELGIRTIHTLPLPLLRILAKIGDLLKFFGYYHTPLSSFKLNNLITDMVYDTALLSEICGELPFSLYDGVKETIHWLNYKK